MKSLHKKCMLVLLVSYILILSYWMMFGFGRIPHSEYMYNLKPFSTIRLYLQTDHFNTRTWVINLLGNVGVFIPFGILLPLIIQSKIVRTFIIFLFGLLILETLQLLTMRGSLDIDDIILNSLGFFIGYWILNAWWLLRSTRSVGRW